MEIAEEDTFSKSARRAKTAVILGWVSFAITLCSCFILTLASYFYEILPEVFDSFLEQGMYGPIPEEFVEMIYSEIFSGVTSILLSLVFFVVSLFLVYWWRWFTLFLKNRKSRRGNPFCASLSSLVPGFGIAFHYFFLKDALAQIIDEYFENEENEKLVSRFYLWFWNAIAALIFCFVPIFPGWLGVIFSEIIFFSAWWRYLILMDTCARAEKNLSELGARLEPEILP